jgi:hypothetical protein
MTEQLKTASAVIEKLGGNRPVAEIVGCKPKAVSNWKKFNAFPARTFLAMNRALAGQGYTAPASLWKMDGAA